MVQSLQWSLTVQIPGGPNVSTSQAIDIEAYDSIKFGIESNVTDMEIELQPGGAGQVKALVITSDHYGNDLNYKVNAVGNSEIVIDQPQVLMGEGAVGLLDPAPASLFFSNGPTENVAIEILVGRDATPTEP